MAQAQRDGFDSRISRIRTGSSPNIMGRLEVGPREEVRAHEQGKRTKARKVRIRTSHPPESALSLMVNVPFALAVGALAFLAGRLVAFHLFTDQGLYPVDLPVWRIELWGDFAIGAVLAIVLGSMLRLTHGVRRTALLLGFAGMMSAEVLVLQRFPSEMFARFPTVVSSYVTAAKAEPFYYF